MTPPDTIRQRRQAWERAVKHSGLSQEEISDVIGMSLSTVRSYGSRTGNVPSADAIAILKKHNLHRAMETLAERYGDEAVRIAGPRL
jgi:hypothetical protein